VVLPGRICHRNNCLVVIGVSMRSRHAVEPISPHTARMASGGSGQDPTFIATYRERAAPVPTHAILVAAPP
jgi:hypothetical protein